MLKKTTSHSRYAKYPHSGAAIRRTPQFGHQRRETARMETTFTHHQSDVLPAIHTEADGARAGHVIQACFPQQCAVAAVIGVKPAVQRRNESKPTGGAQ